MSSKKCDVCGADIFFATLVGDDGVERRVPVEYARSATANVRLIGNQAIKLTGVRLQQARAGGVRLWTLHEDPWFARRGNKAS